jgi:cellulose synthase operon protein C
MLARARGQPTHAARIPGLEEVVRHADADGHDRLAFAARVDLTYAYWQADPPKAYVPFARCLAVHDADPARFGPYRDWLCSHYKLIIRSMLEYPQFSLDTIGQVLDDMEKRHTDAGLTLLEVHKLRCHLAEQLGDLDDAATWFARWWSAPMADVTACVSCEVQHRSAYLSRQGRHQRAVELVEGTPTGFDECDGQPHSLYAWLPLMYLRAGRVTEARRVHLERYRRRWVDQCQEGAIGSHLEFLALSGNEVRGWELLRRYVSWINEPTRPAGHQRFSVGGALVLRRLAETGHADEVIPWLGFVDRPGTEVTFAGAYGDLTWWALRTAAEFDGRNGTAHQTELTTAALGAQPVVGYLPLCRAIPAGGPSTVDTPADDPATALDNAERAYRTHRHAAARRWWHRFDELTDGGQPSPPLVCRRAAGSAYEHELDGDFAAARDAWAAAAERATEAGDENRRWLAVTRGAVAACRAGDASVAAVEDAVRVLEGGEPYVRAILCWAETLWYAGRPAEALGALDWAGEMAADEPDPLLAADAALLRGTYLAQRGPVRYAEAVTAARLALAGYAGCPCGEVRAGMLLGMLLTEVDPDAAGAALDAAVSSVPEEEAELRIAAETTREALGHGYGTPNLVSTGMVGEQ